MATAIALPVALSLPARGSVPILTSEETQEIVKGLPSPPSTDPAQPLEVPNAVEPNSGLSVSGSTATSSHTPPPSPGCPSLLGLASTPQQPLTPQTTGTSNSPPAHSRDIATSKTVVITAETVPETISLREVIVYPCMEVDPLLEEKWGYNNRLRLHKIALAVIKNDLSVREDFYYTSKPRRWYRKGDTKRATIVVSVGDSEDRKAVKRELRRHDWLKPELARCSLQLMVVVDGTKHQSKELAAGLSSTTSIHAAKLISGSHTSTYCGSVLALTKSITMEPSNLSTTSHFVLGGTIIIDDAVYGLTAGHAYLQLESRDTEPSLHTNSSTVSPGAQGLDAWLDDPANPFVFENEEDWLQDSSISDQSSPSQSHTDIVEYASQQEQSQRIIRPSASTTRYPVEILTPFANNQTESLRTSTMRNCDWGLVQLPRDLPISQNTYMESGVEVPVLGSVSNTARPSGRVKVILREDQIICGHLRANATSYQLGPCHLDVRLIYLDEMLPVGCSGTWVVQNDNLCGYIVAARCDARSVYMLPIHSVLRDIRETLGAKEVFIPVQDASAQQAGTHLRPGLLRDIGNKQRLDLNGSGDQFQDPAGPPIASARVPLPQKPEPAHIEPHFAISVPPCPEPAARRVPDAEDGLWLERTWLNAASPAERPTSTALTRSSDDTQIGRKRLQRELLDHVGKVLEIAALLCCLRPTGRIPQQIDVEQKGKRSDCVTEEVPRHQPMLYKQETEKEGADDLHSVGHRMQYVTDAMQRPYPSVLPDPGFPTEDDEILGNGFVESGKTKRVRRAVTASSRLPSGVATAEVEAPVFRYSEDDRDSTSIIFEPEGDEAEWPRTHPLTLYSRSDTDLRRSHIPGILGSAHFQSWALSPPFTTTVGPALSA